MGWNAAGVMVEGAAVETVMRALPGEVRDTGDEVEGFEVLRNSWKAPYGVGRVGSWTVVSDPGVRVSYSQDVLESLSRRGRLCAFLVQPTAWVYGFSW